MHMEPHRPRYLYCPDDPDTCCGHPWPLAVYCDVDGERWPCETKRGHHTRAYAARIERWAQSRIGRPPVSQHARRECA
jgi:hypothetical protein